ncbi:MAG: hypothetical protein V4812_00900 [Pseudomonadota bacterium]
MSTEPNDQALLELLPWYLNDSLAEPEREQVQALLARSAEARESLDALRRLAQAVRAEEQTLNAEQAPPLEMGWARLQRSLQQQAKAPARRDWWKPSLAAAAALMVALQMGILMRPADTESDWRLQSGAGSQQQLSGGYRLQLRFVDQAQWQQVRALLLELDGLLIDGPSVLGMVQVYIPTSQRFADGAALLGWLQQQPVVQHAALLDSVGP